MKMKKILSSVIAGAMIMSTMTFTASAASADVWDGTVDTEWYNDTDTSFTIDTAEEFAGIAKLVNAGTESFAKKTITLEADIDLDQFDWTPIGTSSNTFLGTFDGAGNTISNLWGAADANGLFGYTSSGNRGDNTGVEATIKNFTIDGVTITDNNQVHNGAGAVVGCGNMHTTIKDVTVTGEIIVTGKRTGGILGYAYSGAVIDNCHVTATTDDSTIDALFWACGGIMGFGGPDGNVCITNCSVKNISVNAVNYYGAAGILGNGGSGTVENVTVENVEITAASAPEYNSYISGGPAATGDSYVAGVELRVDGTLVEPEDDIVVCAAKIGDNYYPTLQVALDEAAAGDTIEIISTVNEGTVKLPAAISSLTIEGNGTAVIKDTTIQSSDGSSLAYDGLTINGIIFDNSNIVLTGWRNSGEIYKNITITNNVFRNIVRTSNYAAIHLNNAAAYPVSGLTIKGNVIDGVSGASNSGIYTTAIDGKIVIENNTIKNVAFRPFVLQLTNNNGTADSLSVTGNTFSDSPVGRLQILGTDAEGEDNVNIVITNNVIHEVPDAQELCCWNFNDEVTEKTLSGNYWGAGFEDNYDGFYWNDAASSMDDIVSLGLYPTYTALNDDGTIDTSSIVTGEEYAEAKIGDKLYAAFTDAAADAKEGDTIDLLGNTIDLPEVDSLKVNKDLTITNGTIDITDGTWSGNSIIEVYGGTEDDFVTLTLNNVDVTGNNYSSAFGVIYAYDYGKVVIEDSDFTLSNEKYSEGGVLKGNGIAGSAFDVTNSTFKLENPNRVIANATVNLDGVTIDAKVTDDTLVVGDMNNHAFRNLVGTVNDSKITAIGFETGIKNTEGDLEISGDSVVTLLESKDTDLVLGSGKVIDVVSPAQLYADTRDIAADAAVNGDGYVSKANTVYIQYRKTDINGDEDTLEGSDTYDIVLAGANEETINELASADITFKFVGTPVDGGAMSYTVLPKDGVTLTQLGDRYMFNYDGITMYEETDKAIVIGTLTVDGYGSYTLQTDADANNAVYATEIKDNIVDGFETAAELVVNTDMVADDGMVGEIVDEEITVPERTLTINIDFPNAVEYKDAEYQDMTVTIVGGTVNEEIELGADEAEYTITKELPYNTTYTVTVSGAGYRTARHSVTLTEDKVLNFWNNVMDNAIEVEVGKATSAVTKNFLAGDIVKDNNINIYDLSAVVSYFGTENLVEDHPEYAKYDLNRDGVIDSKDVAYVLVSWNE